MSMQTILVVEDEIAIAGMLEDILGDTGYRVAVAGNGQEALECLETNQPDLVLSDIMMPVMDGSELCKRLHLHPMYNSIPIVLMSAAYGGITLDGCKHAAFLKKPFGVEELLAMVSNVIGKTQEGHS